MRILLVEDETMLRSTIARGLSKIDGVVVADAPDLEAALEEIDRAAPDVIVSDLDLPGRSGLELLGELGRRGLRVPVIFVSGYLQAYRSQIPPHANVEVLEKPVSLDELRMMVQRRSPRASRPLEDAPFTVADYLQLAGIGRRSVKLEVERDDQIIGEVTVWNGETWSATDALGKGESALRRLAFNPGSHVRCCSLSVPPEERTLPGQWEVVLLEAARRDDEERASSLHPRPEGEVHRPAWGPAYGGAALRTESRPLERSEPPKSALDDAFDGAWEEGLAALLVKDYPTALRALRAASELKPDDKKVRANLRRLAELGFGEGH